MSQIHEHNLQGQGGAGGNEEGQENVAAAPALGDDAAPPLRDGEGENEPGEEVSLDLQPLPYDSLSDPEKEAFDRFYNLSMLELSAPSFPFLKSLLSEYPKITMVKKAPTTYPQISFLLQAATLRFSLQTGTTDDSSVTDLLKVMIEKNPSSLIWATGEEPPYLMSIDTIAMISPLTLLWLANTLPGVFNKAYEFRQTVNDGTDIGSVPSPASVCFTFLQQHYFGIPPTVSASQVKDFFDKYPQGLAHSISRDDAGGQLTAFEAFLLNTVQFEFRDEDLEVLKFMAHKRPDLLCTGETPVLFNALRLVNLAVAMDGSLKDRACSLIKILVRACPASIVVERTTLNGSQTPFGAILTFEYISDELKPFFDLTKECLDHQAALDADLLLVQTVVDKVKVIAKIHNLHSQQGRTGKIFGKNESNESVYQEWATNKLIQKWQEARKDKNVFEPLSSESLSGEKRLRV